MSISNDLTTLDFSTIKQNLKNYLQSQSRFSDYDFEGSNFSVLLDILAYNTQLNAYYLNMIGNEMYMDSAILRDSLASHSKELNYLPRSFRSSYANVNITVTSSDLTKPSIAMPRGTIFVSRHDGKTYSFVTDTNIIFGGVDGVFVAENVSLFEGPYIKDSYVVNNTNPSRYILNNPTVDTTSIIVTVIEDNGATELNYTQTASLFGLDSTSEVYFVQAAENEKYEIVFGDGIIGRKPKDRGTVLIEYRACAGELPNGLRVFTAASAIDGETDVEVETNEASRSGAVSESNDSIRFNAPRAFTTQERVVTADDYATLLRANFAEINDVTAYGGEEEDPPKYGKVFVAVDLTTTDVLPAGKKDIYYKFLKPRSPLSIDPVFIDPEYTYIDVQSLVKYNINLTSISENEMKVKALTSIMNYNNDNINGFAKTLRYSRLVADIDGSHPSIVSNDTDLRMIKLLKPTLGVAKDYTIDYGIRLKDDNEEEIIESTSFLVGQNIVFLEDDGFGKIYMSQKKEQDYQGASGRAALRQSTHTKIVNVGTIDYSRGKIQIKSLSVRGLLGNSKFITFYAKTFFKDITAQRNTILSIREEDVSLTIEKIRI